MVLTGPGGGLSCPAGVFVYTGITTVKGPQASPVRPPPPALIPKSQASLEEAGVE